MSALSQELVKGLWRENPTFRMVLGLCPTLAVTTSAANGIAMGLATVFVLLGSNAAVAMVRNVTPSKVRVPVFIVIIAAFVTIVDLLMQSINIDLYNKLGIFIPLITVNCIILGRAEAFASKNTVFRSMLDGVGVGAGFVLALFALGSVRELLGNGTVTLYEIPVGAHIVKGYLVPPGTLGEGFEPVLTMILPPGALLVLGLLMAGMNKIDRTNFATIFGWRRAIAKAPQSVQSTASTGAARTAESRSAAG